MSRKGKSEALHYVESGLDYVWLADGFEKFETPYGVAISIENVDGLHKCIAQCLVSKPGPLSGKEFRFLRTELDLSQETLGELCGVKERTIRNYESEDKDVPDPANTIIRVIYRERYDPKATYEGMRRKIIQLQKLDKRLFEIRLAMTAEGWQTSEDCEVAA